MSSVEVRATQLPAAVNPGKMGKKPAAGPRRAALGELTNFPAATVHTKETLYLTVAVLDRFLQSPTQQHYSTYDAAHLTRIMQHIAKNVVM
ncbi:hypothetical protein FQN60_011456, partial [Etheostoma spectabile]